MVEWKTIENYEGLYEVSNTGQVKALEREIINKNGRIQKYPEKILKHDLNTMSFTTYSRVTLCKNHTTKRFLVHRLLAKAFIPNPLNKEHINHIDNNGQNNYTANLEWCTHSENMIHAEKQGRLFASQSKGGKAGGKVNQAKMEAKMVKLVNTYVNDWFVTSTDYFMRANKPYLPCRCVCGKEAGIELGRLVRKEVTCCYQCYQKQRNLKI